MKKTNLLILVTALLGLAGCALTDNAGSSKSSASTQRASSIGEVAQVRFNLPKGIEWQASKNKDGSVVIYTPKGATPQNAPVKVVYQFLAHKQDPKKLAEGIVGKLRSSCVKSDAFSFKTASKYPKQINVKTLCSKVKGTNIGLFNSMSFYNTELVSSLNQKIKKKLLHCKQSQHLIKR